MNQQVISTTDSHFLQIKIDFVIKYIKKENYALD